MAIHDPWLCSACGGGPRHVAGICSKCSAFIAPDKFCPRHGRAYRRLAEDRHPSPGLACDCAPTWDGFISDLITWQRATFPGETALGAAIHLGREAGGLVTALQMSASPRVAALEEAADALMLLLACVDRLGRSPVDLLAAAQRKLEVNYKRTWLPPDVDGVVEHVREETP